MMELSVCFYSRIVLARCRFQKVDTGMDTFSQKRKWCKRLKHVKAKLCLSIFFCLCILACPMSQNIMHYKMWLKFEKKCFQDKISIQNSVFWNLYIKHKRKPSQTLLKLNIWMGMLYHKTEVYTSFPIYCLQSIAQLYLLVDYWINYAHICQIIFMSF